MALAGEVGELMEIFQRMIEVQSQDAGRDPKTSQAVKDELADVQICLTRLASVLGVDLNEAVQQKLQKNAEKYPADKVRGTNKKHGTLSFFLGICTFSDIGEVRPTAGVELSGF